MPMSTTFLLKQSVHQQYLPYNINDFVAKLSTDFVPTSFRACTKHGGHVPPTNEILWKAVCAIAVLLKQYSSM